MDDERERKIAHIIRTTCYDLGGEIQAADSAAEAIMDLVREWLDDEADATRFDQTHNTA